MFNVMSNYLCNKYASPNLHNKLFSPKYATSKPIFCLLKHYCYLLLLIYFSTFYLSKLWQ